jgi:hypothetical protein
MWDFLKQGTWEPGAVIALVMVIGILVMMIAAIVASTWSRVRREEIRASFRRDMVDRGLPIEQIERLENALPDEVPSARVKKLEAQLASLLVQSETPGPTLEKVLRIYQGTDSATKAAIYDSLEEIIESSPSEEQLVAAVAALCPGRAEQPSSGRTEEAHAAV